MTPHTLLRLSGLAAILAGLIKVVIAVVHFSFFPPDLARSAVVTLSSWQIQQAVDLAAKVLFFWALPGLYGRQAKETGVLGLAGYLLLFTGFVLSFGTQWGFLILGPDFARAAPAVLDADIPSGALGPVGVVIPFAVAGVGLVLFALATLLAKVYPRWVAALLLLGPVVAGVLFSVNVGVGFLVGDVIFGVAIASMGYFLWTEQGETAPASLAAAV